MSETSDVPTPVTVTGPLRRSFSADMFVDLIRPDVSIVSWSMGRPCWTVTFAGTEPGPALSETEAAAVWGRMESVDDADQERRTELRALRDAVVPGTPEADALIALVNYVLGDTES